MNSDQTVTVELDHYTTSPLNLTPCSLTGFISDPLTIP